jgi:hypothetical protein
MKKLLLSMDCVQLGDWLIKASEYDKHILIMMFNTMTGNFIIQNVDDVKKANLIVEYVIEKGDL